MNLHPTQCTLHPATLQTPPNTERAGAVVAETEGHFAQKKRLNPPHNQMKTGRCSGRHNSMPDAPPPRTAPRIPPLALSAPPALTLPGPSPPLLHCRRRSRRRVNRGTPYNLHPERCALDPLRSLGAASNVPYSRHTPATLYLDKPSTLTPPSPCAALAAPLWGVWVGWELRLRL